MARKEASTAHPAILPSCYPTVLPFYHPAIRGAQDADMQHQQIYNELRQRQRLRQHFRRICSAQSAVLQHFKSHGKQTFNDLFRVQLHESSGD